MYISMKPQKMVAKQEKATLSVCTGKEPGPGISHLLNTSKNRILHRSINTQHIQHTNDKILTD